MATAKVCFESDALLYMIYIHTDLLTSLKKFVAGSIVVMKVSIHSTAFMHVVLVRCHDGACFGGVEVNE